MKRQSGFNIIELMVTVAVLGVLLGVGVPGIESYIYNSRLTTQINSLSTSLAQARSEAIKENTRVVVCLSSNGSTCDGYNSHQLWNKGWIVFVDRNNNSVIDHGAANTDDCKQDSTKDCVLAIMPAFPGTNTLTPATSVADQVVYVGDGSVRCNTDTDITTLETCPTATSFFTLCDFRGAAYAKALGISTTGRLSSLSKKPDGSALTCP